MVYLAMVNTNSSDSTGAKATTCVEYEDKTLILYKLLVASFPVTVRTDWAILVARGGAVRATSLG